ncbi:MAG TPA: ATPase, T2SS/T4P/T4SS family, partial [Vicinamibacteria bacterium]|nr:ATPase, T2SS/T4P/T4SS family [Vicinamibacteria bacterium]
MAIPATRKTAPPMAPAAQDLLTVLVAQKVLSAEQAEKVRHAERTNGVAPEQAVQVLGLANDMQIAKALAAESGLPYVKINPLDLDLEVVTKAIPQAFARKWGIVAIARDGQRITVAVHNPFARTPTGEIPWIEELKRLGLEVDRVVATRGDVEAISKDFYKLKASLKKAETELTESRFHGPDLGNLEQLSRSELDPETGPVVTALDHLLDIAFDQRASDIHFEPKRERTLVRLRIDGVLHDQHAISKIVYEAVVSRIKLLCGANLAEKRRPQDGRIKREWWVDGAANVRTAGRSTTVVEQTAGTNPFAPLSPGDTIQAIDRNGVEHRLKVVTKASDASITLEQG